MAADCEQTRARMLDLLYSELSAGARADVDADIHAHWAGCAACQAELTTLESTRDLARRSMAADQPPPRVHAAIVRAATAALPAPRRTAPPEPRPSVWAWLRGKWTLPTFATVGAVAVFLLASRIFFEPERTYQRGRQGVAPAESAAAPAAQPVDPTGTPAPEPAGAASAAGDEPGPAPAAQPAAPPVHRRRAAPPARADHPRQTAEPRPEAEFAAPPPAAARSRDFDDRPADDERAASSRLNAGGQGSAGAATRAPAAPKAKAQPAKKTEEKAEQKAEAPAAEQFAAPPARAAPSPAPRAAGARESAAVRADRLFTQARWTEAAIAYRELLRDDPLNPDVPRWRQRLAACEAALTPPR